MCRTPPIHPACASDADALGPDLPDGGSRTPNHASVVLAFAGTRGRRREDLVAARPRNRAINTPPSGPEAPGTPPTVPTPPTIPPEPRPRRLAWFRTPPFHGGYMGSNPIGVT